jgi:TonB family protein
MCLRRVLLIFLFCLPIALPAQTTEADLKSRLMGRPLYLRGFWRDNKLHFDSTGHLLGSSAPLTFTLSGFDLKSAQIKPDKLILWGERVGLEFSGNKQTRVPLGDSIHIEIDAIPNGDYGPALDAIFVDGLAALVPSLPSYWKTYAVKNFLPAIDATSPAASTTLPTQNGKPARIGGKITAPRVLSQVEPPLSSSARALKYSGTVLINLWVETTGKPSHLSVVRPAGLGLDEGALASVVQYVFQPAMQDGKPVLVELNIEVNFQVF